MKTPLFFRLDTDRRATAVHIENLFAGPQRSACWLIGGGPSLDELPCDDIARSPIPKLCVNLAGTKKLRPDFWTAYDPTVRFHRSIYLDPGVLKFVHRRRAMDLVPESTFKVCDCPGVVFFDRDPSRSFANLLSPGATGIIDWSDTMVQAIDILYRLGFRTIYLAGCEMRVRPAAEQLALAAQAGCEPRPQERLADFLKRCAAHGVSRPELEEAASCRQYHFDECKPLAAAVQTDQHYFRIAQCLRLSRSCLVQHGVELISVTPGSRLNDYFPFRPAEAVLQDVRDTVGDPDAESARGCYTQTVRRWSPDLRPMRDVSPPASHCRHPKSQKTSEVFDDRSQTELIVEHEGWQRVLSPLPRPRGRGLG
jgi:hypothetical protein